MNTRAVALVVGGLIVALVGAACGGGDDADSVPASAQTLPTTTSPPEPTVARPYEVFVPTSYDDSTPAPLVVFLHGYGTSGDEVEKIFQLEPLAQQRGFLYTHPDGTEDEDGQRFWNATDGCCNPADLPVDDSTYLSQVISTISTDYSVDPRRVYVMGVSNGGFMAYRMACDHADQIAAIVSLAGATFLDADRCQPSQQVSVLEVHGTADEYISYDGGTFVDEAFPSAEATVTTWASYDGCDPKLTPTGERLDVEPSIPGDETVVSQVEGCPPGVTAELWTMTGAGHIFSFAPDFVPSLIDFLLAHPRP